MKLVTLLHFYQPPNQQEDILLRIVKESYLPVTRGLLEIPEAKVAVNISGCLTEMLVASGFEEVLENLKKLASRGQVEFTGSAKFHALLPLLPQEEIERQITQNYETNSKYFGELYSPVGFFPPEMAVSQKLLETIAKLGYKWVAVPQLGYPDGEPAADRMYKDAQTGMFIVFRNRRISSLILSAVSHSSDNLVEETKDLHNRDKYWVGVMDAETFGHHRIGHEKFLFDVLKNSFFDSCTVLELLDPANGLPVSVLKSGIRPCTWTNEEQDFWLDKEKTKKTSDRSFILWKDPQNPIHTLQWQLAELAINEVHSYKNKSAANYLQARDRLDRALSSDQYWWASAKPWWSLEMLEQGAYELKLVLSTLKASPQSMQRSEELYRGILDKAFEWQRTGYIRKKHLENSSTYLKPTLSERTNSEWYNQLILEFEDQMKSAAAEREFEKAVKWRDAIEKLTLGNDIYDVLHVVDELWSARAIPSVKPFFDHKWGEFSEYAKKHFKGVENEQAFESWKRSKLQ
jgi:hypothetical protein